MLSSSWARAAVAGLALAALAGRAASAAPNVIVLLSDDQRFDTIHALGNAEIRTPHLDRLVSQGFTFTHAHIMGAQQGAVCVPSRAMLLTGRSLFGCTTGPGDNAIPATRRLWPEHLKLAGYETIGVGKWHNDRAAYARSFTRGGPVFFGGMSSHTALPVFDFDPSGAYPKARQWTATDFSSVLLADGAIRALGGPIREPFFLYVAFTAPHDPRTPPEPFASAYPPKAIALPRNFRPQHPFDNGELRVRDEQLLPWPRDPVAVRREIGHYYGMISHLDMQVGRILQALEASGRARNTVVVFAGDNGLAVGQHGLLGKQNLYEHSVRVPLIFSGPGIPAGRRSAALCYLFDVFPTVCELTGVPIPEGVQGQSLVPVLKERQAGVRDTLFAAYRDVQRMVRDERWKLIAYPRANREQLFDLKNDPDERSDLSAEPRHAAKLQELRGKLRRLQQHYGDPMIRAPLENARRKPTVRGGG